ncbi:hypothetical protein [Pseudoduganella violaceinigra]|uniref:hypothetical protein n=1 Tax=Pseudoduganella violaceinigra TaxID=246602 RepID=UPI0012B60A05|nr:hypothetical protein [Pseudoduganella violaceinigra]
MPKQKFSAKLMNDTKWREVLTLVARLSIQFEFSYVGAKTFQIGSISSLELLGEHGIADPGIGGSGPAAYKDILAIRVFRFAKKRNPLTGSVSADEALSEEFLRLTGSLGQLPIEVQSEFIYVHGYGR